jgi:alanyl-tRNA synthetase
MSAIDYENMKNLFEYILKEQNKMFREAIKEDRKAIQDSVTKEIEQNRKALQDSVTEIEKSVKRSELALEKLHRELLDSFGSKTNECTHVISQVPKETEVEMTTDNQMIEKNVELIN